MHEHPPVVDLQDEAQDFQAWEQQAASAEQAGVIQKVSIAEYYSNEVFDVFGQKLTLRQAEDLCPVPRDQRSLAASEAFVARLVEKSGRQLPEQFAHLRSKPPESKPESSVLETVKNTPKTELTEKTTKVVSIENPIHAVAPENALVASVVLERAIPEVLLEQLTVPTPAVPSPEESAPVAAVVSENLEDSVHQAGIQPALPPSRPVTTTTNEFMPVFSAAVVEEEAPKTVDVAVESLTVSMPATASEAIAQQLGDMYQAVLQEASEEQTFIYHETDVIENRIADVLDMESREASFDSGEELILPSVEADATGNLLSIPAETEIQEQPPVAKIVFSALPAAVEIIYTEVLAEMEPVAIEQLTELVETIELVAGRLQVLVASERGDGEEATQIEAVLEVYYEELCSLLGLPVELIEQRKFIANIRSNSFMRVLEQTFDTPIDESMREMKRDVSGSGHALPVLVHQTANLTRFVMKLRGLQPSL
jgi:hypothetical protein